MNDQTVIVDGHNVILRSTDWARISRSNAQAAREALVAHCGAWLSTRRGVKRLVVVFDGEAPMVGAERSSFPGLSIRYAPGARSADDMIVSLVRSQKYGSRCAIVSEDSELLGRCRSLGASALEFSSFRALLKSKRRRPGAGAGHTPEENDKDAVTPAQRKAINADLMKEWGLES